MQEAIHGANHIRGRVRAHMVYPAMQDDLVLPKSFGIWWPNTDWTPNLVVYEWAAIVGRLLTVGESKYRIGGMYLEFENLANPGDPISIPSLSRARGIEYYQDLLTNPTRDYLRVPFTANQLLSSDAVLFPQGNQPVFFARSQGVQGVHGKTFSHTVNSVIFGCSLVAFLDATDASQDLIFSSFYFPTDEQQPKTSISQVGIEWELSLM